MFAEERNELPTIINMEVVKPQRGNKNVNNTTPYYGFNISPLIQMHAIQQQS